MANRYYTQFMYSLHKMPVIIDGTVAIGATGAVSSVKGAGIQGVTRLAQGVYQIKLQDNYFKLYAFHGSLRSPSTGSAVSGGSFVAGTLYEIDSLGNTTDAQWLAAGVPAGVKPAVGVSFVAAGVGAGTGTVKAEGVSGLMSIELAGNPDLMMAPTGANQGAVLIVQCLNASGVKTDPANGSVLDLSMMLSNSSVLIQSE